MGRFVEVASNLHEIFIKNSKMRGYANSRAKKTPDHSEGFLVGLLIY